MRRQLLEFLQAFTFAIFCLAIISFSLWVGSTPETSPKYGSDPSFGEIFKRNSTTSIDRNYNIVSGGSAFLLFSQEKNKNQAGGFCCLIDDKSISLDQLFFKLNVIQTLKFSSLLDQLHNVLFFF